MPGSVSITEARGQPSLPSSIDFTMLVVGQASTGATATVSPLFGSPTSLYNTYQVGDAVDAALQALSKTPGNPNPSPLSFYRLPTITTGSYGSLVTSGVTGTAVPSLLPTATSAPFGTWQIKAVVTQGGTIGATAAASQAAVKFSLTNGNEYLPPKSLGSATSVTVTLLDGTSTGAAFGFTASNTLNTGDTWTVPTKPPAPQDSDITSMFSAVASFGTQYGIIAIEPAMAQSDFSTLISGLNTLNTAGRKPLLLCRFRDPNAGESDATYVSAFQTFNASLNSNNQLDDRIGICAGSAFWLNQFGARTDFRSFLPPLLARLQSFVGLPREKLAHNPGLVGDGPLEGTSLVDPVTGILTGHDEQVTGGIEGVSQGYGGGICLYRPPNPNLAAGAYVVSSVPTLYPATSKILTIMDRRVADAMERDAAAIAWQAIGGVQVYDTNTLLLFDDAREAIAASIRNVLARNYALEIQNPNDTNLVSINAAVTVSGANVTISGSINPKFFGYAYTINLTFSATR